MVTSLKIALIVPRGLTASFVGKILMILSLAVRKLALNATRLAMLPFSAQREML